MESKEWIYFIIKLKLMNTLYDKEDTATQTKTQSLLEHSNSISKRERETERRWNYYYIMSIK